MEEGEEGIERPQEGATTRRMEGKDDGRKQKKKRRSKKPANPLIKGILAFCHLRGISLVDNGEDEDKEEPSGSLPSQGIGLPYPSLSLSLSDLPKRYTIYPPLLLLPFNFNFTTRSRQQPQSPSSPWADFYAALSDEDREILFRCIVEDGFRGLGISRVAVNAPIAAETETERENEDEDGLDGDGGDEHENDDADENDTRLIPTTSNPQKENVLRSPSGLVPVYGDWGPSGGLAAAAEEKKRLLSNPTTEDFAQAFWTSVSQHKGITQCWAPLYTMFSRGNIAEKARILGLSSPPPHITPNDIQFPGLTTPELNEDITHLDVVDLYVGIGYFTFSYLRRGVRRVFGFDINPWSIEGLRRGCEASGFPCVVVRIDENGEIQDPDPDPAVLGRIVLEVRCVAVLGDNRWAAKVVGEIRRRMRMSLSMSEGDGTAAAPAAGAGGELNLRHANLGLLPSSRRSWDNAVKLLRGIDPSSSSTKKTSWLHVHENVDVRHIEDMKRDIVGEIDRLVRLESGEEEQEEGQENGVDEDGHDDDDDHADSGRWSVSCVHVNQVKTYAPGVMHCVFDIEIKAL